MKSLKSFLRLQFIAVLSLTACSSPLKSLGPGDSVPEFSALNQSDQVVQLRDFKGKSVLIFFYPKDESPGCTQEAMSFKDEYSKIEALGGKVIGISRQGSKEHQDFIKAHELPFELLVDQDGSIADSFGVGRWPIFGYLNRKSVLVGPDGKVVRFYEQVDPSTHVKEVLADLEKLSRNRTSKTP